MSTQNQSQQMNLQKQQRGSLNRPQNQRNPEEEEE
jgi:hypothetical protein